MAALRYFSRKVLSRSLNSDVFFQKNHCIACTRLLNYSAIEYDEARNPKPIFFKKEIQSLLKYLTRVDMARVFKKKKLGESKLADPEYKFMTNEELQEAIAEAQTKADEMLQIPPIVPVRKKEQKVFSRDPALQGLETSRLVFTDITFGVSNSDRLIAVRELDGTLQEAEWELRNRVNQVYFPMPGREILTPKMFQDENLENLLTRKEYLFILDRACIQFEPNDPHYQKVVSITYQHISDNNGFDLLRSTRHFGALVFFLVWNKSIDNLLLDLIETMHIDEANKLLELYSKIHEMPLRSDGELAMVDDFIQRCSTKRGELELALQAYKDVAKQRELLEKGIKSAHGMPQ